MTRWLNRSRMNDRITRGENWSLASCRLTTVREKTTPTVVIIAPATVDNNHVAALLLMDRVSGISASWPSLSSMMVALTANAMPASMISAGWRKRLSAKLSRNDAIRNRHDLPACSATATPLRCRILPGFYRSPG